MNIQLNKTCVSLLLFTALTGLHGESADKSALTTQWSGFRGKGNSVAEGISVPMKWNDASIAWRAPLDSIGQSSPVIWNDLIFVTSIKGPNKEELLVHCVALDSGKNVWTRSFKNLFPEEVNDYFSRSAPTPVVDKDRVYALFECGTFIALTHLGETAWRRELAADYGPFEGNHGQGASPIRTSNGVVVLMDHKGPSFIASLDPVTGETLWKTARDTSSAWASPMVVNHGENDEWILCGAAGQVNAYDPQSGTRLWNFDEVDGNNVPSATIHGNHIAISSSQRANSMVLTIKSGKPEPLWKATIASNSFGSPLIHKGRVYFVNKAGIVYCYALESGELLFDHRLPSIVWASPLGSDGHVWFFCRTGETVIMKAADTPIVEVTSSISIDETDRVYGYAVSDGKIIFRIEKELVCVQTRP